MLPSQREATFTACLMPVYSRSVSSYVVFSSRRLMVFILMVSVCAVRMGLALEQRMKRGVLARDESKFRAVKTSQTFLV